MEEIRASISARPPNLRRLATAGAAIVFLAAGAVFAAESPGEGPDLVDELLAIWAPPPDWRAHLGWPPACVWAGFLPSAWVPPDDAPSELLVAYWASVALHGRMPSLPSPKVRARLLEACEKSPDLLAYLVHFLPDSPETAEQVRRIGERAMGIPKIGWDKWIGDKGPPMLLPPESDASRAGESNSDRLHSRLSSGNPAEIDSALGEILESPALEMAWPLEALLARDTLKIHVRRKAASALLACKGIARSEVVSCLEAVTAKSSTPEGREFVESARLSMFDDDFVFPPGFEDLEDPVLPPEIKKGLRLEALGPLDDETAASILDRADSIRAAAPEAARELVRVVASWPLEVVERRVLVDVLEGDAFGFAVHELLKRRERIPVSVPGGLQALRTAGGTAAGVGAVLGADPEPVDQILDGGDAEAQRALLACSRLIRQPLPLAKVRRLLDSRNDRLSRAAQAYLEGEGSREAREMVWARRPEEVRIVGGRMEDRPGHIRFERIDEVEARLQGEMQAANGPDEICALIGGGYTRVLYAWIIRLRNAEPLYEYEREGNVLNSRTLRTGEWSAIRGVVESGADDLPPLVTRICDGVQWEYVHLTRRGGCSVFMNNPGVSSGTRGTLYDRLERVFLALDALR